MFDRIGLIASPISKPYIILQCMDYSNILTKPQLSPYTISVLGTEMEIPTYGVHESDIPDLLAMDCPSHSSFGDEFVQRIHDYRWVIYTPETGWFSVRLLSVTKAQCLPH